jgi:hypothetical protein
MATRATATRRVCNDAPASARAATTAATTVARSAGTSSAATWPVSLALVPSGARDEATDHTHGRDAC